MRQSGPTWASHALVFQRGILLCTQRDMNNSGTASLGRPLADYWVTRMRCRVLRERESCANFPEVPLQLLNPSDRKPAALKHIPSCMLSEMQRVVIRRDAPVLAFCRGRSNTFALLSVMRTIFASGFLAGFVLSFRDKRSRFFDRDYDPSKSLLHDLAQRLPRFPHARTGDKQ